MLVTLAPLLSSRVAADLVVFQTTTESKVNVFYSVLWHGVYMERGINGTVPVFAVRAVRHSFFTLFAVC